LKTDEMNLEIIATPGRRALQCQGKDSDVEMASQLYCLSKSREKQRKAEKSRRKQTKPQND
jgi:hypothetical protein